MSILKAAEIPGEAYTRRVSGVPLDQRTKVLPNVECPSCFRKGTIEVFFQKHGESAFCFFCGHRETSFYGPGGH